MVYSTLVDDANRTPISQLYTLGNHLGTGKFSVVKEGKEKATGKMYALKIMKKTVVEQNNLLREVEIMRQLDHTSIILLKEIFESDSELILVLELVTGGELFDKIVERVSYTEEDASVLVKDIIKVLLYIHSKDIVHCDLKPENLLYSDTTDKAVIKLCDFGLSQIQPPGTQLTKIAGTPTYMAPEIANYTGYGRAVDMWSMGVIVYILLCGFPPFDETTGYNLDFPSPEWDNISESAKDLIKRLLVVEPAKRLTANQALSHLWVSGAGAGKNSIAGALPTMKLFNSCRRDGTAFRGRDGHASVFDIFTLEKNTSTTLPTPTLTPTPSLTSSLSMSLSTPSSAPDTTSTTATTTPMPTTTQTTSIPTTTDITATEKTTETTTTETLIPSTTPTPTTPPKEQYTGHLVVQTEDLDNSNNNNNNNTNNYKNHYSNDNSNVNTPDAATSPTDSRQLLADLMSSLESNHGEDGEALPDVNEVLGVGKLEQRLQDALRERDEEREKVKILQGQADLIELSPLQRSIKDGLKKMEKIITSYILNNGNNNNNTNNINNGHDDEVISNDDLSQLHAELMNVTKMFNEESKLESEEEVKVLEKKELQKSYAKLMSTHKKTSTELRVLHAKYEKEKEKRKQLKKENAKLQKDVDRLIELEHKEAKKDTKGGVLRTRSSSTVDVSTRRNSKEDLESISKLAPTPSKLKPITENKDKDKDKDKDKEKEKEKGKEKGDKEKDKDKDTKDKGFLKRLITSTL